MIRLFPIFFLLFSTTLFLAAQEISFERRENAGAEKKVLLRLKLSREYLFVIPGAGKPIRKLETMDLVLLTGIKIEKLNQKGLPVSLILTPEIPGGTLNGRNVDPALLKGRKIRAELEKYPCTFTALDGTPLAKEAIIILSALFRSQQNIQFSEILGASKKYQPGGIWKPNTAPILKVLEERRVPMKKENIKASARFENKFKVNGMECVSVVLNLSSVGTHAYDFQLKTRLIFPIRKEDGGFLRLTREGVEVVDRKTVSGDYAAMGSALRIVTKEQFEATYTLPGKRSSEKKSTVFF